MENDELTKSLVSLIDETLEEIEDLKKSRYAAAEVDLHADGENLNDKVPGTSSKEEGSLGKEEDEDEDDDDKEDKDKDEAKKGILETEDKQEPIKDPEMKGVKKEEAEKAEAEKAEVEKAVNREADPDPGFPHGKAEEAAKADVEKAVNREADPNPGFPHGKAEEAAKAEAEKKEKEEAEKAEAEKAEAEKAEQPAEGYKVKKGEKDVDDLMKSYIDSRIEPLEDKLAAIHKLVEQLADQPMPAKGVTAKMVPLKKSEDDEKIWEKTELTDSLLDLKKSGKSVDGVDFTKIDLGANLDEIATKYGLN